MTQRDADKDGSPAASDAAFGAATDADGSGAPGEQVWERFESILAERSTAPEPPARAPARPLTPPAPPRLVADPRHQAMRPAPGRTAPPPAHAAALGRGSIWRHRAEGAVAMGLLVLLAFAAGWAHGVMAPPPPESQMAFREAEAEAGFAEDSMLALAETARVAAIAAADPPYRVVLHVEDGVEARDLARLDTAIRAWGFPPAERVPATDSTPMPEVRFHDEADREAALTLGGVAERLLGEAVLTPPARGGDDPAPLAGLAAPEGAEAAASAPDVPPARLLELHVPARPAPAALN